MVAVNSPTLAAPSSTPPVAPEQVSSALAKCGPTEQNPLGNAWFTTLARLEDIFTGMDGDVTLILLRARQKFAAAILGGNAGASSHYMARDVRRYTGQLMAKLDSLAETANWTNSASFALFIDLPHKLDELYDQGQKEKEARRKQGRIFG